MRRLFEARRATPEERRAFYVTGEGPKGVWYPLSPSINDPGAKKSATLACPTCGQWAALLDHVILDDGTVMGPPGQAGSVVCPYNCGFHDMVKLLGWGAES